MIATGAKPTRHRSQTRAYRQQIYCARSLKISTYRVNDLPTACEPSFNPDFDRVIDDRIEILHVAADLHSGNDDIGSSFNLMHKRPIHEPLPNIAPSYGKLPIRPRGRYFRTVGLLTTRCVGGWSAHERTAISDFPCGGEKNRMLYGIVGYGLVPATTSAPKQADSSPTVNR